ncbi:MAG: 50S ribosomal protein L3 [Kiritimatiellia bacterium]
MNGLLGKKIGMTQIFDAKGVRVPVTIIEAGPCVVVQRKTKERDGYEAVQLGFGTQKGSRLNKPLAGHLKKSGASLCQYLREFRLEGGDEVKPGDMVSVEIFKDVTHVDVTAYTKGRGFQGVVKRHRMAGGPSSHGSTSKRRIGAVGQRAQPGTIAKGHRLPGHMGHRRVTTQNLRLVQIRSESNLMFVEGSVPGPNGGIIEVRRALKKRGVAKTS